MIVMKFGGTSLGNSKCIKNVAEIIQNYQEKEPLVVVSAVTKVTDLLIKLAQEISNGKEGKTLEQIKTTHLDIINELKLPAALLNNDFEKLALLCKENHKKVLTLLFLDQMQSYGEKFSSKILAAYLKNQGIEAQAFDAGDLGLLTDNNYGEAEPLVNAYLLLRENLKKYAGIHIITGFIGKTEKGEITTLGRGGSDYTAAIIGNAINAEEIQIWTDVNGILSTDPKIIPQAKTIPEVSFAEASELAYFGAKVLHPKTMLPAMQKNIPVRILNSFNPQNAGTIILKKPRDQAFKVKAIAVKKNITLIDIKSSRMLGAYGFLSKIFSIFNKYKKSVDVIATSEVSVSLTIDNLQNLEKIQKELEGIGEINIYFEQAIVCIVGEGMREALEVVGDTFSLLAKNKIRIDLISQGASQVNITFLIEEKDVQETLQLLHQLYFGEQKAL